jgi:hypothetical protein
MTTNIPTHQGQPLAEGIADLEEYARQGKQTSPVAVAIAFGSTAIALSSTMLLLRGVRF